MAFFCWPAPGWSAAGGWLAAAVGRLLTILLGLPYAQLCVLFTPTTSYTKSDRYEASTFRTRETHSNFLRSGLSISFRIRARRTHPISHTPSGRTPSLPYTHPYPSGPGPRRVAEVRRERVVRGGVRMHRPRHHRRDHGVDHRRPKRSGHGVRATRHKRRHGGRDKVLHRAAARVGLESDQGPRPPLVSKGDLRAIHAASHAAGVLARHGRQRRQELLHRLLNPSPNAIQRQGLLAQRRVHPVIALFQGPAEQGASLASDP
jgi:hypothetical protein